MLRLFIFVYSPETFINGENSRNFSKFKKTEIWVLGNVIMKAHAKFQEASSIGNTQKSRGTVDDM